MKNDSDSILSGIFLLSSCHVCYAIITFLIFSYKPVSTSLYATFCPGRSVADYYIGLNYWGWAMLALCLGQSIYVIPLYRHFNRKGLHGVAAGIAIAALITFFLNGIGFLSSLESSMWCRAYF